MSLEDYESLRTAVEDLLGSVKATPHMDGSYSNPCITDRTKFAKDYKIVLNLLRKHNGEAHV